MNIEHLEIVKELMISILYDNGYIDRWHPEETQISEKWQYKIAPIAGKFFDLNPDFLSELHIENISIGSYDENEEIYGKLEGYSELSNILDDYYINGCGVL